MTRAELMYGPRRAAVWRAALLAWGVAAIAGGAHAHTASSEAALRGADMTAVVENANDDLRGPEAAPGTAWTDAMRIQAYLRAHRAAADAAFAGWSSWVAYAGGSRRVASFTGAVGDPPLRRAGAPRAAAVAASGAMPIR